MKCIQNRKNAFLFYAQHKKGTTYKLNTYSTQFLTRSKCFSNALNVTNGCNLHLKCIQLAFHIFRCNSLSMKVAVSVAVGNSLEKFVVRRLFVSFMLVIQVYVACQNLPLKCEKLSTEPYSMINKFIAKIIISIVKRKENIILHVKFIF